MESLLRALCLWTVLIKILFIHDSLPRSNCFELSSKSLARFPEFFVLVTVLRRCVETFVVFFASARTRVQSDANWTSKILLYLDVTSGGQSERGKRGGKVKEREWTQVQIDWTMERLVVATRGISTYMASRRNIARYARAHNVSRVLLKLLANDVGGVGWQLE